MFSNAKQVLLALLLSLLIHALVFSVWPHIQAVSITPLIVQGELIAPIIAEPLPGPLPPPRLPARIEPESTPILRKTPAPLPRHEAPVPAPGKAPDAGVALPLLTEKPDTASAKTNDFVVPEAPPLLPGDKLPMASRPAETTPNQAAPASAPSSDKDKMAPEGSNGEDQVDRAVLAAYGQGLWEMASKSGGYPSLALQRGWQGVVKVQVKYSRSGVAYQISVKDSSGYKVLDQQALEMVKQACAQYALPDALTHKAFSVVVPIEFKLM